jgi:hypothetical protein
MQLVPSHPHHERYHSHLLVLPRCLTDQGLHRWGQQQSKERPRKQQQLEVGAYDSQKRVGKKSLFKGMMVRSAYLLFLVAVGDLFSYGERCLVSCLRFKQKNWLCRLATHIRMESRQCLLGRFTLNQLPSNLPTDQFPAAVLIEARGAWDLFLLPRRTGLIEVQPPLAKLHTDSIFSSFQIKKWSEILLLCVEEWDDSPGKSVDVLQILSKP